MLNFICVCSLRDARCAHSLLVDKALVDNNGQWGAEWRCHPSVLALNYQTTTLLIFSTDTITLRLTQKMNAILRCATFIRNTWITPHFGITSTLLHQQQVRDMSKYLSKSAKKRLVLTTKRARKGYYKGNGATKEGRLTSKGKFIVDPLKRLQLIIPDLTGFKVRLVLKCWTHYHLWNLLFNWPYLYYRLQLKPYIARSVPRFPPEKQRNPLPR